MTLYDLQQRKSVAEIRPATVGDVMRPSPTLPTLAPVSSEDMSRPLMMPPPRGTHGKRASTPGALSTASDVLAPLKMASLPTCAVAARLSGGWVLPPRAPKPEPLVVGALFPSRKPLTRSESDLVRRSRHLIRHGQRHVFGQYSAGAGPRPVARLGPAKTGQELPLQMHHPRSSLPGHYGYSLVSAAHTCTRVHGHGPAHMCMHACMVTRAPRRREYSPLTTAAPSRVPRSTRARASPAST